ncbi:MAG: DUF4252 domain-containing protein [Bacteroidota bacterium]
MRPILIFSFLIFSLFSSFGQESIIKDFAESRRDVKYCLYPSTLRMINIQKDPSFYELVNDIEKLLIYKLDSATTTSKEYLDWTNQYAKNGFEEYISINGVMNLMVYGKEEEYVGFSGANGSVIAFYLRGNIGLQKIPELMQNFEAGNILSLLTDQLK